MRHARNAAQLVKVKNTDIDLRFNVFRGISARSASITCVIPDSLRTCFIAIPKCLFSSKYCFI